MSNPQVAYPFDPTGKAATNKITAERQPIAPPELGQYHFVLPAAAPYFADSVKMYLLPSRRELIQGQDWAPGHYFHDASLACADRIYGSFVFYDQTLQGAIEYNYQTLGGVWTISAEKILEILSNKLLNPRRVNWEQIVNLPIAFPVIDHEWHLDDMVGAKELEAALNGIRDAILASGSEGLTNHINDKNNPHQVTKAQVGLGSVQDYPVADIATAQAGVSNSHYLTVLRGAQMMQALYGNRMDQHINDSNNPHNTTKAQVGLSNVENNPTATQAEAEAGTATNRFLTVLRGKQLVDIFAVAPLNIHINNKNNPHAVTKAQVGLGNVQNFGKADTVAAQLGVADDVVMTPLTTKAAIDAIALAPITSHVNDTNNPHNTTKAQVGLDQVPNFGPATQAEAEEGNVNNKLLTVLRGRQMVAALFQPTITNHINDSSNPHGTTKAQVGLANVPNYAAADDMQALAGTANNLLMTPRGVALYVANNGGGSSGPELAAHLADLNNPHQVNKEQVGLGNVDNFKTATSIEAQGGTLNNVWLTPLTGKALIDATIGVSLTQHTGARNNPHQVTAEQVGAYDKATTDNKLNAKLGKTGVAADSTKFAGQTYAQVMEALAPMVTYPANTSSVGNSWTKLGSTVIPSNLLANPVPDIVAYVTGGDDYARLASSTYLIRLSPRAMGRSSVTLMEEESNANVVFGYVYTDVTNGKELTLYMRTNGPRQAATATVLSQNASNQFYVNTNSVTNAEPTGIVYLSRVLPPYANPRATFGDVNFGDFPGSANRNQIVGSMVQQVPVATTDADELTIRGLSNSVKDDYPQWLPSSAAGNQNYYADQQILDDWVWDDTAGAIQLDTTTVPNTGALLSPESSLNYTFEVDVSSNFDAAKGAGVIAASVVSGGRQYTLAVIRTPGGMNKISDQPGGEVYTLLSVVLNPLQNDGRKIAGKNGLLKWGDGQVQDTRPPADFIEAGKGWSTNGATRIRVKRAGNILTIDTSQYGATAYVASEQIVIDLADTPTLSMFVDAPSQWGLISLRQPNVSFKVVSRPRQYKDYIRIGATGDKDKQRYYTYNGTAWEYAYLGINHPAARPGRLYFSDYNGVLYQSQRNARLRPVLVEAYSRAGTPFLTP